MAPQPGGGGGQEDDEEKAGAGYIGTGGGTVAGFILIGRILNGGVGDCERELD